MRLAGQLIAQRATPEQIAQLRRLTDVMDAACARSDTRRFQDLNIEFHAALVEAARNRRLQEVYQGLSKESRLFRRRALVSKAAMKASNQEHRAIVDAVARHDCARAAATMESHILRGKERFMSAASDELDN
jgi:DNA-binding GntR family transcriptional regulator